MPACVNSDLPNEASHSRHLRSDDKIWSTVLRNVLVDWESLVVTIHSLLAAWGKESTYNGSAQVHNTNLVSPPGILN